MDRMKEDRDQIDSTLLRRIAGGDSSAMSELYDRFSQPLYSMILRMLGDSRDAEDTLQEVFVQIWKRAPLYDGERSVPFTWAVVIARSRALDRIRARSRRIPSVAEREGEHLPEQMAEPEASFVEERRLLEAAFNGVSGDQRQALEMAFFRGLTQAEIAEELGEPLGTVKARIRRGLMRLRELLKDRL